LKFDNGFEYPIKGKLEARELSVDELRQTEITTVKCAVYKLKFGKVAVRKVATVENAVFIFAFCQRVVSVKGFVCDINFLHFSVLSIGTMYLLHLPHNGLGIAEGGGF